MDYKKKLIELYCEKSKHSRYQIMPNRLKELIGDVDVNVNVRNTYEYERLEYILKKIDIKDKRILDIGGNSGFFTFEMIENGAKFVHYYEGNKTHAEFVELASKLLKIENKIKISNEFFLFDYETNLNKDKYDITLLLNVLHHIGYDYGSVEISKDNAKKIIIQQLNNISAITKMLVFQLGFNWKGNRNLCLFENGTKSEMIDYILQGTNDNWELVYIGVAQSSGLKIQYCDLNDVNIKRNDKLGEFLNRPIFIMKSKRFL